MRRKLVRNSFHITACSLTLSLTQESISSTSYTHIFLTKVFSLLRVWLWTNFHTKNVRVRRWWNWRLVVSKLLLVVSQRYKFWLSNWLFYLSTKTYCYNKCTVQNGCFGAKYHKNRCQILPPPPSTALSPITLISNHSILFFQFPKLIQFDSLTGLVRNDTSVILGFKGLLSMWLLHYITFL